MHKISIFQVVLLSTFSACAIAGVLIFAFVLGGNTSTPVGSVEVWGTFDRNEFTEALLAASDLNQDLLGVRYEKKDEDSYMSDITNALASGKGPDMFLLRQDYAHSQEARLITIPFTQISQADFDTKFADAAAPFVSPYGILGIPFLIDPLVLYWNKDALNSNGFAQAPQYWDELYDMATKITRKTETGSITKSALAFGGYSNVNHAKDIISMLIMQAGGNVIVRDSDGNLQPTLSIANGPSSQPSIAALRFFTEFADPSRQNYTWSASRPRARDDFTAGNLAMYVGLASEARLIEEANPNLSYAIAAMPQRRGADRAVNAGVTYAYAIPRTSKNPEGALAVAYILAGQDISKAFSTKLGIPSARRDVLASKPSGTVLDLFNRQAILVRSWIDPEPTRTDEVFRALVEDTVSGAYLLGESIQRAEQKIGVILDEYPQAQP